MRSHMHGSIQIYVQTALCKNAVLHSFAKALLRVGEKRKSFSLILFINSDSVWFRDILSYG